MRKAKFIGVCGLITGIVGLSHAGFKDALKSAAGSTLGEVAKGVGVDNATVGQPETPAKAILTEIKDCTIKDGSWVSKDDFIKATGFSSDEYTQWLNEIATQLEEQYSKWKRSSGLPPEGIVFDKMRVKLPAEEASSILYIIEPDEILISPENIYLPSIGNTYIKFNYTTLVTGRCDERGEAIAYPENQRVIYTVEKICSSVQTKIADEKSKRAALAASIKQKELKAKKITALKEQRTGAVAYAPKDIHWGDTKEVLIKVCGIESIGGGDANLYFNEDNDRQWDFSDGKKHITLWLYPKIGVYQIWIEFSDMGSGRLVEKYTEEMGDPSVEIIKEKPVLSGLEYEVRRWYRWTTNSTQISISSDKPCVYLVNDELCKKINELEEGKKLEEQKKKEAEIKAQLDF